MSALAVAGELCQVRFSVLNRSVGQITSHKMRYSGGKKSTHLGQKELLYRPPTLLDLKRSPA